MINKNEKQIERELNHMIWSSLEASAVDINNKLNESDAIKCSFSILFIKKKSKSNDFLFIYKSFVRMQLFLYLKPIRHKKNMLHVSDKTVF